MIRPVNFGFNEETATDNAFQVKGFNDNAQEKALKEFDNFVELLRKNKIDVLVVDDTKAPYTPDSIFPNNWISFHEDGRICLYPMYAPNRRLERKETVFTAINNKYKITKSEDLTHYESKNKFLEGTGSMVLDRENKIAFACISERTDKEVLDNFCKLFNYTPVAFLSVDSNGKPIYHTNVVMCVADKYVVICLDTVKNKLERDKIVSTIENAGKEIIEITLEQMNNFAGNMLQVKNTLGDRFIVMSEVAKKSLTEQQITAIEKYNSIISADLYTIEKNGGGSARCMLAEIFLEEK